uniref:Uncharacterized protein n=1 Tax=Timema douglasi TaxID=61478 RepID=A0A7R8VTJ6_TIMDO|nr:unnamed protein product [Timema douglasi]
MCQLSTTSYKHLPSTVFITATVISSLANSHNDGGRNVTNIECDRIAFSSNNNCSEFEQKVTKVKKILSADDSLDRMKEEMEKQISDQPFFTNIEASLESISSSPEYKSYEEIFKDLGGSELEESQDQDKLENLVEDLVKTSAFTVPQDVKENIFSTWNKMLSKKPTRSDQ